MIHVLTYFRLLVLVYSLSLVAIWSLINPSLAPKLVGRIDLLGRAGEFVELLSVSSIAVRLPADTDGCIVGDGEKPGIPKTSNPPSSSLGSEASRRKLDTEIIDCVMLTHHQSPTSHPFFKHDFISLKTNYLTVNHVKEKTL